ALRELPAAIAVSEAGSVRRRKETFRDLDIIASATNPADLTGHFASLSWVVDIAAQGDTKATVVSRDGHRFDLRVVPPESFGNLLQHFTGSKDHNVAMREDAVRRGRIRVLRGHRPLALPPRGTAAGAARGDRRVAEAISEAPDPRRRRGEHPLERRGGRGRRGSRVARLDSRVGPQRA